MLYVFKLCKNYKKKLHYLCSTRNHTEMQYVSQYFNVDIKLYHILAYLLNENWKTMERKNVHTSLKITTNKTICSDFIDCAKRILVDKFRVKYETQFPFVTLSALNTRNNRRKNIDFLVSTVKS